MSERKLGRLSINNLSFRNKVILFSISFEDISIFTRLGKF